MQKAVKYPAIHAMKTATKAAIVAAEAIVRDASVLTLADPRLNAKTNRQTKRTNTRAAVAKMSFIIIKMMNEKCHEKAVKRTANNAMKTHSVSRDEPLYPLRDLGSKSHQKDRETGKRRRSSRAAVSNASAIIVKTMQANLILLSEMRRPK